MKKKTLLISTAVVALAATGFIFDTLSSAGVFLSIDPHFSGQCTRVNGVTGAEDITIDPVTGVAYISAMDRRTLAATGAYKGGIFLYSPGSYETPEKLSTDISNPFHPHGISLWKSDSGLDRLFVVNHPPSSQAPDKPARALSQVDVFEVRDTGLKHLFVTKPERPISLNDVAATGPETFFASIDKGSETDLGKQLELYARLPRSGILYGSGTNSKQVLSGFVYANGVQTNSDGSVLYVAETTGKRLSAYQINRSDGALTLIGEEKINSGLDNIEVTADGSLYVVGHPKTFAFLGHAGDSEKHSPSQVFVAERDGDRFQVQEIYLNDGTLMSGASVAAPYEGGFLIGSVFEPFILDCRF